MRKIVLRSHDPDCLHHFKSLRSSLKSSIASDHPAYIKNTENSLSQQPKKFWSFFKTNQSLPNEVVWDNTKYNTDFDIANAFAKYFSSVLVVVPCIIPVIPLPVFLVT